MQRNPKALECPQGCFPLAAESRLYVRAPVFAGCSAGAFTQLGRTRRGSEQGVAPMRFHADLHVHSKYSRATSRDLDLEHLAAWACRKGIGVVGTGDFTHPAWCAELKQKLVPAESGLYRLRDDIERAIAQTLPAACRASVRFMLEVEISTIYKKADRTRKVHHLIYAPDFETVDRMSARLARIGNIASHAPPHAPPRPAAPPFPAPTPPPPPGPPPRPGPPPLSGPGTSLAAVVRGSGIPPRLLFDCGVLRPPPRPLLRGRARPSTRPADEL